MNIGKISGINDIDGLKENLLFLVEEFDRKERNYQSEIKILNEQIKSLQDRLFGRKTEKIHKPDGQLSLFNMSEPDLPIQEEPEDVTIKNIHAKNVAANPCRQICPA
jgi:transposase